MTFLSTNVLGVDNIFSLGFKIKKKHVRKVLGIDAAPHCTTLYLNFDNFDPEKLERLNEELVKRFWRHRRRKTGIIGIDSMLLEIFGDYEGAEVGWDHVNNKSVRCYKLFAAFELGSNYPVCFKIEPGNTPDSKMLVEMCARAKKVVGKENIRNFPSTSLDAVRSHIALLFIQFLVLSLFKHYVLDGRYRDAQLKTLRTQVFDVFEDESSEEITEEQYREIIRFRDVLHRYLETMNCVFPIGTVGISSISPVKTLV